MCTCRSGSVECAPLECPTRCSEFDQQLYHKPGECCPVCIPQQIPCHVTKHNTYVTLDYINFNFDGSCRYVLTQDCANMSFSVHIESDMESTRLKTLFVYLNCLKLKISQGRITLNREALALPYLHHSHEFDADIDEDGVMVVNTYVGVTITWKPSGDVILQIPKSYQGNLCGLCGTFHKRIDYYIQTLAGSKQFVPGNIIKVGITLYSIVLHYINAN